MGKKSQTRRARRQRRDNPSDSRRPPSNGRGDPLGRDAGGSHPTPIECARGLLALVAQRRRGGEHAAALGALDALPLGLVDRAAEGMLEEIVGVLWQHGWQPAEVQRQGRLRTSSGAASRLVDLAISGEHRRRSPSELDPAWSEQVANLALPRAEAGWLAIWRGREGLDRVAARAAMVDSLVVLGSLPALEMLMPPPGAKRSSAKAAADHRAADPMLQRVRSLLAKAESTEFEPEAEALTAKAFELMARHSIDQAMLENSAPGSTRPTMIRLPVDAPYADAKSWLLQTVAQALRCRAVFTSELAISHVVGFGPDLAAVELLFTSLLLQAQRALTQISRDAAPGARTRASAFRASFWQAFTARIGERLAMANERASVASANDAASLVPVLAARREEVDQFMDERFRLATGRALRGGFDGAGWSQGEMAGDRAHLTSGELDRQ